MIARICWIKESLLKVDDSRRLTVDDSQASFMEEPQAAMLEHPYR